MMGFRVVMYAGALVGACVYLANLRQVRGLTEAAEHLEEERPRRRPRRALRPISTRCPVGPPTPARNLGMRPTPSDPFARKPIETLLAEMRGASGCTGCSARSP